MAFSRNIDGVELRYTRGELSVTDLSTIPNITTDDEWNAAIELDVTTVIPRGRNQTIRATSVFPSNGIYKVFARMHNNVDNLGPIFSAGTFIIAESLPNANDFRSDPEWAGTLQNMAVWPHTGIRRLYPSPSNHRAITLDDWNGGGAYPFGAYDGTADGALEADRTQYTTREIDFGSERRAEVFVEYTGEIPPLIDDRMPEVFPLTLTYSMQSITANPFAATTISVTNSVAQTISARYIRARLRVTSSTRTVVRGLHINWRYLD